MKLVRYEDHDGAKLGAVKGEGIIDLSRRFPSLSDDVIALINQWRDLKVDAQRVVAQSAPDVALAKVRLLAPVVRPGKVMGIGLNYADHIKEPGQETPRHQVWFTKAVTAINGPFDPIEIPRASSMVDYGHWQQGYCRRKRFRTRLPISVAHRLCYECAVARAGA